MGMLTRFVKQLYSLYVVIALIPLVGCVGADLLPGRSQAGWYAGDAGWAYSTVDTGTFFLTTALSPFLATGETLTVYLEGDGRAFVGKRTPSADPTPGTPTALRMAVSQSGPVGWIARPCQYTRAETARGCDVRYWTSHRYAPEVIESVGRAIDRLKARSGAQSIVLVGYSGGGAVAALLAAQRADVTGFVTVAGNIDIGFWVARDKLAPLAGSLDPADYADRLSKVPQVHFTGGKDSVVTSDVAEAYMKKLERGAPARVVKLAEFDHHCCWVDAWLRLLQRPELNTIPDWR